MIFRIAACCVDKESLRLKQGIQQFSEKHSAYVHSEFYQESTEFLEALEQDALWDMLIIAIPGAMGMETVVSAKALMPKTPVLWCSDDAGFAVASYRLRCSLFMPMPLDPNDIDLALQHHITGRRVM